MIRFLGGFAYLCGNRFMLVLIYFLSDFSVPVCAQADLLSLVKEAIPSVVVVNVFNRDGKWRGSGTGFFVKEEGLLITNRHVIDGKAKALAKLANGEFLPVEGVLSEDIDGDLVLLALGVKGSSFPALRLADTEINAGQPIVVIGNPMGKERIVSYGIVSGVKDVTNFGKVIQHTAAISSGSSGSPIMNRQGEVIGVVVGKTPNLNLAVSVDRVKILLSHSRATPRGLSELLNRDEEIWLALLLDSRYQELIDFLKKRIAINPNNAMAHYFLGSALTKLSRDNEAVEAYKKAIQFEPDGAYIYYNLGVSYIRLGNYTRRLN